MLVEPMGSWEWVLALKYYCFSHCRRQLLPHATSLCSSHQGLVSCTFVFFPPQSYPHKQSMRGAINNSLSCSVYAILHPPHVCYASILFRLFANITHFLLYILPLCVFFNSQTNKQCWLMTLYTTD